MKTTGQRRRQHNLILQGGGARLPGDPQDGTGLLVTE